MALNKKVYVDNQTVIPAANLNAIQDEIIANASALNNKSVVGHKHKLSDITDYTGGGSEPSEYLKSAAVSGNKLTLTNKDGTTVEYAPSTGGTADSVDWSNVLNKPSTFTPSEHNHDSRYYTETEMDTKLAAKAASTHTHSVATTSTAGFMSAADKTKLDSLSTGGGGTTITVDSALSSTSTNPVQNKIITSALSEKAPAYQYSTTDLTAGTSALATGVMYLVYE